MNDPYLSDNNYRRSWFAIILIAVLAIFTITNLRLISWDFDLFPYVLPGTIAHYYINYIDFGFAKRGLLATLIYILGGHPNVTTVHYLGYAIGLTVCFAGGVLIYKLRPYLKKSAFLIFVPFLIFNSGTFSNLGYDLGRLDQLLILCSILSLYFIHKGSVMPVIAISMVALLIHELYLIMFLPLLIFVMMIRNDIEVKQILYLLLGVGGILMLLFYFGKIEQKTVQGIANTVQVENYNFMDVGVIWKRSLENNIMYTQRIVSEWYSGKIYSLIIGGAYTAIVFGMLWLITAYNNIDWRGYPVILLSSLLMFVLAIDYSRWYALMIVNAFLFFGYMVINQKDEENKVRMNPLHITILAIMTVVSLILGPIGIIHSFPLFNFF